MEHVIQKVLTNVVNSIVDNKATVHHLYNGDQITGFSGSFGPSKPTTTLWLSISRFVLFNKVVLAVATGAVFSISAIISMLSQNMQNHGAYEKATVTKHVECVELP